MRFSYNYVGISRSIITHGRTKGDKQKGNKFAVADGEQGVEIAMNGNKSFGLKLRF